MTKSAKYTVMALLIAIIAIGGGTYGYLKSRDASLVVSNDTFYNLRVTVGFQNHKDSTLLENNVLVAPGEKLVLSETFRNTEKVFYVFARSAKKDTELIRWYLDLPYTDPVLRSYGGSGSSGSYFKVYNDDQHRSRRLTTRPNNAGIGSDHQAHQGYTYKSFRKVEAEGYFWNKKAVYHISDDEFKLGTSSPHSLDIANKTPSRAYRVLMEAFEKPGELTVTNTAPYKTDVSYHYQSTKDSAISVGWKELYPGESMNVNVLFRGSKPVFHVYAQSSKKDAEYLRWYFDWPHYFEGVRYHEGNYTAPLSTKAATEQQALVSINSRQVTGQSDSKVGQYLALTSKKVGDTYQAVYTIKDENFFQIYETGKTGANDAIYARRSRQFYDSIQHEFVKTGKFIVRNATPFKLNFSHSRKFTKDSTRTTGWYSLEAGEDRTLTYTYYGTEPNLSVYAETSSENADIVRYAFDLPANHIGKKYYQPDAGSRSTFEEIDPIKGFNNASLNAHRSTNPKNIYVKFGTVIGEKALDGIYTGLYQITDQDFPSIYVNNDAKSIAEASEIFAGKAKQLSKSIRRRTEFHSSYQNFATDVPYILGLQMEPGDSKNDLGVQIAQINADKDILGGQIPFQPGDIITSFDGEPVFDIRDVSALLIEHASSLSGGIGRPISFTLIRDGMEYRGETLYFFNPYYYGWPKRQGLKAFLRGLFGAVTYGFDDELYASFVGKDSWKAWRYVQEKARLAQFYPKYTLAGNIGGAFASPGTLLLRGSLKRGIAKLGFGRKLSGLTATVMLESGESALWTIGDKSPLMGSKELMQEIKYNMKFGAAFGLGIGSFRLLKK